MAKRKNTTQPTTETTPAPVAPTTPTPTVTPTLTLPTTIDPTLRAIAPAPTHPETPTRDGVINTIRTMLRRGATKGEILTELVTRFPERDAMGMATTVSIQISRLGKKHGGTTKANVAGRGVVYTFANYTDPNLELDDQEEAA